jgi:hypothetical protein
MFGRDLAGSHYNPTEKQLTPATVGRLKTKWVFEAGADVSAEPTVVGGVVYFGSWDGKQYAVDAKTGARIWDYACGSPSRSGAAYADGAIFFGDLGGSLYSLEAKTGKLNWKVKVDSHKDVVATSSPIYHNGPSVHWRVFARRGRRIEVRAKVRVLHFPRRSCGVRCKDRRASLAMVHNSRDTDRAGQGQEGDNDHGPGGGCCLVDRHPAPKSESGVCYHRQSIHAPRVEVSERDSRARVVDRKTCVVASGDAGRHMDVRVRESSGVQRFGC